MGWPHGREIRRRFEDVVGRTVTTIRHGIWMKAAQNVANSILNNFRFSVLCSASS